MSTPHLWVVFRALEAIIDEITCLFLSACGAHQQKLGSNCANDALPNSAASTRLDCFKPFGSAQVSVPLIQRIFSLHHLVVIHNIFLPLEVIACLLPILTEESSLLWSVIAFNRVYSTLFSAMSLVRCTSLHATHTRFALVFIVRMSLQWTVSLKRVIIIVSARLLANLTVWIVPVC